MTTRTILIAAALAALVGAGCDEEAGGGATAASATAASATAPTASAEPAVEAPPGKAEPAPSAEATGSAGAPAKKYDCGAKGQKYCPMQGWMKKVMAPASSSDDGAKLAEALTYVSKRPPPGYADWVAMAKAGAAKAKAGDIEGAKASCKKCHDAYKQDYRAKMRGRPW